MVLTDHSPSLTVANGLSAERLERQLTEVAALNAELAPFRILTGIEVDILVRRLPRPVRRSCSPASTWWSAASTPSCGWPRAR